LRTSYVLVKNLLKEGIIFTSNEKKWMAELMVTWLREVWDRRPRALLKKTGMMVLYTVEVHLTFILPWLVIKF
jgi:hypothetical protein